MLDVKDGGANRWQQSSDGRHLVELLEKLRECKDDEQQRSWALHEDEHTISTHLSDLLDLLVRYVYGPVGYLFSDYR